MIRKEAGRLAGVCIVSFVVVPGVIYVLSYIPFLNVYPDKSLLVCAVDNTRFMLNYHVDAVFDHAYASPWYSWLVDQTPLLDARSWPQEGYISAVVTLGSPLIV